VKRIGEIEERLTLAKITEVSRRARQINFHCLNELVYALNQANLNEYSYTIRLLFQVFGLNEDLFVESYIGYLHIFLKEAKQMNRRNSRGSASLRSSDLAHLQNANSQLSQRNIGTLSPICNRIKFSYFFAPKINLKIFFFRR
jgi:hypothetical protein